MPDTHPEADTSTKHQTGTESQNELGGAPPGVLLYQLAIGHYFSRALYVAAKLKLADLLGEGPLHHQKLAQASDTHPPSLNRLLRLLASAGIFEELEGGRFQLTPLGELLRSNTPGSMRAIVMLFGGTLVQDSWKDLEFCVRSGQPAFRREHPDGDAFTLLAQDPETSQLFDEAMATFAPHTAAAVASSYDFSSFHKVADIGGGNGALLIGILKANPHLRGIVFDQPQVAEKARQQLLSAGLSDRIEALGGDFFKEVPEGAEVYLLKHVIHDWDDKDARVILENCRKSMPPEGRLLILEGIYPPRIDQSPECRGAAANDLNMLVSTGGRQRSKEEFRDLFDSAGLRLTQVLPTPARVSIIEGLISASPEGSG